MCDKKLRYNTEPLAHVAADLLVPRLGQRLKVYCCPDCGRWCLTRGRKRRRR